MRRSFIDNNELVNDITWHARPETRDSHRRGVPLDFRGLSILSYNRRVVIPYDEDIPSVDRSQQPSAPMVPEFCGVCKKPGHKVIQCWAVDENGFTTGCGVCISGQHDTEGHQPKGLTYSSKKKKGLSPSTQDQAFILVPLDVEVGKGQSFCRHKPSFPLDQGVYHPDSDRRHRGD
jgi:hypothetical protein